MRLDNFWSALESLPCHSLITAEWCDVLGAEFEDAKHLLSPSSRKASVYPCPSPGGDGCPRRVVVHGPGDVVAVCNDLEPSCDRLVLSDEDIILYDINIKVLCDQLRQALRLLGRFESTTMRRTWRIGHFQPGFSDLWSVYLHLPLSSRIAETTIMSLILESNGPFLILTPTTEMVPSRSLDFLRDKGCKWLALADLLSFESKQFESKASLADVLGGREERSSVASPEYVFRHQGEYWEATYLGKKRLVGNKKGLSYLKILLQNPGQTFGPTALFFAAEGPQKSQAEAAGFLDSDLRLSGSKDEPLLDSRAMAEFRRRLKEIRSELEEAESRGDYARKEDLLESKEFIEGTLRSAVGLGDRSRTMPSESKKLRDRVNKALERALAVITKHHPEFHRHLLTALHSGTEWSYRPEIEIPWEF